MSAVETLARMSVADYLAFEQESEVRHELVDGYLYAMTGASDRHEEIALNLAAALRVHLRGMPCRVYKGDLKIRIADDFYYPDVFVRCAEERGDPYFKTDPILVAEVLSPGTHRHDRGDKMLACMAVPALREYLLIAQDRTQVDVLRRDAPLVPHRLSRADDLLRLESVDFSIRLGELYE